MNLERVGMQQKKARPVFLNLLQISLPPNAIASIAHRVAGVLLIVSLPFLIYLFDLSLRSQQSFTDVLQLSQLPWVKIYLYGLLWAISHHFIAGIRYFLIDLEYISGKSASRFSAIMVLVGGLIPLLVYLVALL